MAGSMRLARWAMAAFWAWNGLHAHGPGVLHQHGLTSASFGVLFAAVAEAVWSLRVR